MSKIQKKLKKIELTKICRACMYERDNLTNIIGTNILTMMTFCTGIKIDEHDELPTKVCTSCFHKIAAFYSFKCKVERTDNILRTYINDRKNTESEISDGPPPLIPIGSKSTDSCNTLKLPENTPALVPIVSTAIEKLAPIVLQLECPNCGDGFTDVTALKQHRTTYCHSSGLQCNICKKEFSERKKLIGHLKGHMVVKHYACKICSKRYPSPSTFKVHMRTHTGERPFKCQVCNKGFVRWAGVIEHMKTHNSIKPYNCDTCGKGFKIASNLERHKNLHSGFFPFCCNFCGKTFRQSVNLQLHIRTYHTFEKPYLCNECGKGFVSSTGLNRHMWVHTGYKPYHCKQCNKAYTNSNDLKIHSRSHFGGYKAEDKPHVCNVCDMRFFHACRLAKHMKIHDKRNCAHCNKVFSSSFWLLKHLESEHVNESLSQK